MTAAANQRPFWYAHATKLQAKAAELADAGLPAIDSFEYVAREWLASMHSVKVSDGHSERTRIRLEQDIFPWLGRQPIAAIKTAELLTCLRRVEARGAIETAHRIKQAPEYYKWTQWIFTKLYEKGLAYESNEPINWCPSCKTGLANEDVKKKVWHTDVPDFSEVAYAAIAETGVGGRNRT